MLLARESTGLKNVGMNGRRFKLQQKENVDQVAGVTVTIEEKMYERVVDIKKSESNGNFVGFGRECAKQIGGNGPHNGRT